jgi:hypothetical protein
LTTPSREQRARESRDVFELLTSWTAPTVDGLSPSDVKNQLIVDEDMALFRRLGEQRAWASADERDRVKSALIYAWDAFGHAEQREAGHLRGELVFQNIFDLLLGWMTAHEQFFPAYPAGRAYRGQRDARWALVPSCCRSHSEIWQLNHPDSLTQELALSRAFVDGIEPSGVSAHIQSHWPAERDVRKALFIDTHPHVASALEALPPLHQDAIVQHYVSGTPLLDFTTSIYVAAFFATLGAPNTDPPEMGAIYRVFPKEVRDSLRLARVVAFPELPASFSRIHRQKGLFLMVEHPALIHDSVLCDRWAFYHTDAGRSFESPPNAVVRDHLLPETISLA